MKHKCNQCLHCGTQFWVPAKKVSLYSFCSKKCRADNMEQETTGIVLGRRLKKKYSKFKGLVGGITPSV